MRTTNTGILFAFWFGLVAIQVLIGFHFNSSEGGLSYLLVAEVVAQWLLLSCIFALLVNGPDRTISAHDLYESFGRSCLAIVFGTLSSMAILALIVDGGTAVVWWVGGIDVLLIVVIGIAVFLWKRAEEGVPFSLREVITDLREASHILGWLLLK